MTAAISKGTLNLRFMQNAKRAEPELEINSAEAEPVIKDESHWEVSREVKEMWGIASEPSSPSASSLVTHETSYLPFVFSCINTSGSPPQPVKLRGRRTWNKRGQEVTEVDQLSADDDSRGSLSSSAARQDSSAGQHHHEPASKRLASISSFGPGSSMKETAAAKRTKPRNAKSAQEIIREAPLTRLSGISEIGIKPEGGDTPAPPARVSQSPRSPPVSAPSPNEIDKINNDTVPPLPHPNPRMNHHPPTPPRFLKPAGVDEPPSDSVAHRDGSRLARQREADDINHGTQRHQNLKRHRDDRRGASSGGGDGGVGGALTSDRDGKRKKSGAAAAAAAAAAS